MPLVLAKVDPKTKRRWRTRTSEDLPALKYAWDRRRQTSVPVLATAPVSSRSAVDELRPVRDAQLPNELRYVPAHGDRRDLESLGDRRGALSTAEHAKHLRLPCGQRVGTRTARAKLQQQFVHHRPRDDRLVVESRRNDPA